MWCLGEQTEGQEQTDEFGHHGESISSNAQSLGFGSGSYASFHFAMLVFEMSQNIAIEQLTSAPQLWLRGITASARAMYGTTPHPDFVFLPMRKKS